MRYEIGDMRYPDKLEFGAALPLPLGEVPPKGAERVLRLIYPLSHGFAVPAPPEGEPRGCGR